MHIPTVACSHLLLLVGGVQSFGSSFQHRQNTLTGRASAQQLSSKLGESPSDTVLDLEKTTSNGEEIDTTTAIADDIPRLNTEKSTETVILANDEEFIKSQPDKRSYRAITLPNQLTVLLASDPTTDVEAASVHVRAGHFDDPPVSYVCMVYGGHKLQILQLHLTLFSSHSLESCRASSFP